MRYFYIHIIAAAFLIVGMGIQTVVNYRRATRRVTEQIDLQTQLAQEKLRFHLYDVYDVKMRMEEFIKDDMQQPDDLLEETRNILTHFPHFFCCYAAFPEYYLPSEGKWYCPCSYRLNDSIRSVKFGDAKHDYFTREWYKGALASGGAGFWSKPYHDEEYSETIYTFSDDLRDKNGNLICVIASDFNVSWIQKLLDRYRPFDESVLVLYSADGDELAISGLPSGTTFDDSWIVRRKTLEPINIDIVMAVPTSYIWKSIRLGTLLPLSIFLLGIIVVAVLIRRLWCDREESNRLQLVERDLQIAHNIQMGILKGEKGEVKEERDGVDIYAEILPMREVGGDLYDFHHEGDTLWFIVGDVSGKGVPAAMFMSAAVTLFRAAGRRQKSPKAIMEEMNAVLSGNNPSLTFVTAFIGCLRISSGELLYCNAGHCAPILLPSGHTSCTPLVMEPNIPLGYDGRYEFVEQGCMLGEGDTLVLYTDGVTEARDGQRKMLGMSRWMKMVEKGGNTPLLGQIKAFTGKAEPTDDITLMTIRKNSPVQPVTVRVANSEDQWPLLRRAIHEYGLCSGAEKRTLKKLEIAAEEAVINSMRYSQATYIELTLTSHLSLRLTDDGIPFDPTAHEPNADAVAERQIGGLGISLIRQIADEIRYERIGDTNQLTIIKQL